MTTHDRHDDPRADASRRRADLLELNDQYLDAALSGDVEWFRQHLADEFVCIESDGSVLDRASFLVRAAAGAEVRTYTLESVSVGLYGDVALVRASGRWIGLDGRPGRSRYLDVYVLRDGAWSVVSAQITRPSGWAVD